jgi:hypothetical protein
MLALDEGMFAWRQAEFCAKPIHWLEHGRELPLGEFEEQPTQGWAQCQNLLQASIRGPTGGS